MSYAKAARALALLACLAAPALAADEPMRRVLVCAGPDASMELYLPQALVAGHGADNVTLTKPAIGAYTLDLTGAGKGKVLEWVRVSLADGWQDAHRRPVHARPAADAHSRRGRHRRLRQPLRRSRQLHGLQRGPRDRVAGT